MSAHRNLVLLAACFVVLAVPVAGCNDGGGGTPDSGTADAATSGDAWADDARPEPDDARPEPGDARSAIDAGNDAGDGFWLTGTIRAEAGTIPPDGKLLALWNVSDDEPRTGMHKRGEMLRSGATFEMPFPVPPAEARMVPELAVAFLVHVAADAVVPDGDIDDEELPEPQGGSIAHAVFHRTGATGLDWADAFPLGFSCGRCVQNPDDNEHDHYVPMPCSEFEVVTGLSDDARGCNWW